MTWHYPYSCVLAGQPNVTGTAANKRSQSVKLVPDNNEGELRPISDSATYKELISAYYKTGFVYDIGNDTSLPTPPIVSWFRRPAAGNTCYVWHYAPFAWNGTMPEVFAAVLMQMGMSKDYINQTAFTNAHGRYFSVSGDEPWIASVGHTTRTSKQIYCWRKVGQKVVDLLLEIARHGRDMYFTNEAGKIDISSFTTPESTQSSLSLTDGVTHVEWEWSSKLIFNRVRATWGHAFRAWGTAAGSTETPDNTGYSVVEEAMLDSYTANKYVHEANNAASIVKFGDLPFGETRRIVDKTGAPHEKITAHFPMFLDPAASEAGWLAGEGGMQHLVYWLASDSKSRRMVTIIQDFRALDWGIGTRLSSVAVTDDGQTIDTAWCIEREYDFSRLTVTSVLMEQPANT